MTKVIVLGHEGMLGQYVYAYLTEQGYDVICKGRNGSELVLDFNPTTVIVNCAGAIPQRYGDEEKETFYALNVQMPRILEQSGSRVIHISSDCVFSGRKGHYSERDVPDPVSLYGASKYLGEPVGKNCITIRTSIIADNKPYGLMGWYLSNTSDAVDGYINHIWNGVTCLQLAKEIERRIREGGPTLYHYHSPDRMSKYMLLHMIHEIYGGPFIRRIAAPDHIDRTMDSEYSFIAPPVGKQLKEMFDYDSVPHITR